MSLLPILVPHSCTKTWLHTSRERYECWISRFVPFVAFFNLCLGFCMHVSITLFEVSLWRWKERIVRQNAKDKVTPQASHVLCTHFINTLVNIKKRSFSFFSLSVKFCDPPEFDNDRDAGRLSTGTALCIWVLGGGIPTALLLLLDEELGWRCGGGAGGGWDEDTELWRKCGACPYCCCCWVVVTTGAGGGAIGLGVGVGILLFTGTDATGRLVGGADRLVVLCIFV